MRIRISQKQTFPPLFYIKSHFFGPDGTEPSDQIRCIFVYNASSGTSLEWKSLTIHVPASLSGMDPHSPIAHILESAFVIRLNKLDHFV